MNPLTTHEQLVFVQAEFQVLTMHVCPNVRLCPLPPYRAPLGRRCGGTVDGSLLQVDGVVLVQKVLQDSRDGFGVQPAIGFHGSGNRPDSRL